MKRAFFILTRIDSARLPAKAMLSLGEKTVLGLVIEKLKRVDNVVPIILTTDRSVDDAIEHFAEKHSCACFRASGVDDVSGRIAGAIEKFDIDSFYRINADSPCLDLNLIALAGDYFDTGNYDFVSNLINRTYPYGVAVELFNSQVFINAIESFNLNSFKEHPTSFFYKNLDLFRAKSIEMREDFSEYRLVIDNLDDYLFFLQLLKVNPAFFDLNLNEKITLLKDIKND